MTATRSEVKSCVVVDTSRSPYSRLAPVGVERVELNDSFWEPRLEINRRVTIPSQYEQCEATGRIDNFRRASGRKDVEFQGIYFNDSDVYKWLEAAVFSLARRPDPELNDLVDVVVDEIMAAQDVDGYLDTYFTFEKKADRWTNIRDMHELYCAGHLIQAAVAHHRATGKPELLQTAIRLSDHICETFGPEARRCAPGHEEIEMALVELYRETGCERYLRHAGFFIDQRGSKPPVIGGSPYHQDHLPFRQFHEMVGHAVRALYLNSGATDVYAETGEPALIQALDRLWQNMTTRRMYVTGGLGARHEGEAFGADFELPNDRAYTETCAAIGSVMWNWRLLALSGDARYADLMELTLYNGMLAGLSLDGKSYFYQNPLSDEGEHRRQPWFGCACCPPNVARMLASLPGYFYSVSRKGAWVHLYAAGKVTIPLPDGGELGLTQTTDYPWSGEITIDVTAAPARPISLFLRVPGWCETPSVRVNGQAHTDPLAPDSYVDLAREWRAGDRVELSLPMPVRLVESHPHLTSNTGQRAICRGPLVYCVEHADNPDTDVRDLHLTPGAPLTAEFRPDLLNGVVTIKGDGKCADRDVWQGALYRASTHGEPPLPDRPVCFTAIPYYAWANREPGPMRVWLPCA